MHMSSRFTGYTRDLDVFLLGEVVALGALIGLLVNLLPGENTRVGYAVGRHDRCADGTTVCAYTPTKPPV